MADAYLMYALWYLHHWETPVAFMTVGGTPLHKWREFARSGMSRKELLDIYTESVKAKDKKNIRVAILTGEYQAEKKLKHIVIDVDSPPGDKDELMKTFAKEGYTVVNTPKGFHLHAYIPDEVYIVSLVRGEQKEKIGEGGALFAHPWTSPPSLRSLGDAKWFKYSFVLPSGERFASYDVNLLKQVQPPEMRFSDIVNDIELILGAKIIRYNPMAPEAAGPRVTAEEPGRKSAVFLKPDIFIATAPNIALPRCVAWVLYHYYNNIGLTFFADKIAGRPEMSGFVHRKVPHGQRFLVAAAVALFLAHVIEWIKYDEILSIIAPAIEDWPADDGGGLDKKLKYLFLASPEGYVYPRYGGLGTTLSPKTVAPTLCDDWCFFSRLCRARNPWRPFIRLAKRKKYSEILFEGYEYVEE